MHSKRTLVQKIIFFAGFIVFFPRLAWAEPIPRHSWEFGTEVFNYVYKEPNVNVKVRGVMYGLVTAYTYHPDRFMLKLEGRNSFGQVDYSQPSSGSNDNTGDYVFEGRVLAGYDVYYSETSSTTYSVYSGFGYRFLSDPGGGTVTTLGLLGYDRKSNYYYLPIGLQGASPLGETWTIKATVELDILLAGRQTSELSTADPRYSDLDNDQNSGYGLRGAIRFQRAGERFDLAIEPFIRYWNIKDSERNNAYFRGVSIGEFIEPANNTLEAGVGLSASF